MRVEFIGGEYDGDTLTVTEAYEVLFRPAGDLRLLCMAPDDPAELITVLTYEKVGRKHPNGPVRYRLAD